VIASISGVVLSVTNDDITVEVGGVGLAIRPSSEARRLAVVGKRVSLATYLLVREDDLTLFGFSDAGEREVFENLKKVSGVGPKTAMQMVSALGANEIRRAINEEDPKSLTRAPGVGSKVAHRVVLELAGAFVVTSANFGASNADDWAEVMSALTNLGWGERDAREAVSKARESLNDEDEPMVDSSQRLKVALSYVNRR
jgi:Holliday junction DNA helicase RuvA